MRRLHASLVAVGMATALVAMRHSVASASELDAEHLASFLDPLFADQLARSQTPAAAIIVVQRDRVCFQKGYGLSLPSLSWAAGWLTSVLVLLSPLTAIVMVVLTSERQLYSIPPILYTSLGLLLSAGTLGSTLPIWAIIAWKRKYWSLARRCLYTAVAMLGAGLFPLMNYWNVLGFRF